MRELCFFKKGGRRHFQDVQAQDGRTSLPLIIDCLHGPETLEQGRGGLPVASVSCWTALLRAICLNVGFNLSGLLHS